MLLSVRKSGKHLVQIWLQVCGYAVTRFRTITQRKKAHIAGEDTVLGCNCVVWHLFPSLKKPTEVGAIHFRLCPRGRENSLVHAQLQPNCLEGWSIALPHA